MDWAPEPNCAHKMKSTENPNAPKLWDVIGQDQAASAGTIPSRFGRAPRNFAKHCHNFSGEEWKQQGLLFLPIYLEPHLPEVHYDAFCNYRRAGASE
jgi:hypothetical protein